MQARARDVGPVALLGHGPVRRRDVGRRNGPRRGQVLDALDRPPTDVQRLACVAQHRRDLPRAELDRVVIEHAIETAQPRLEDLAELLVVVGLEREPVLAEPRPDLGGEVLLGQIHRVGDGDDDEARVRLGRPVEKIVDDVVLLGEELIDLVDEDDADTSDQTASAATTHDVLRPGEGVLKWASRAVRAWRAVAFLPVRNSSRCG